MKLARYDHPESRLGSFESMFRHPFARGSAFAPLFNLATFPALDTPRVLPADVFEDDPSYHVRFEVPGLKKSDLRLELEDRVLKVAVQRGTETDAETTREVMSRSLTLPENVQVDAISAKLEDGMLTVTLPKQEARKPRTIELT
jgi:HSP20 family protein